MHQLAGFSLFYVFGIVMGVAIALTDLFPGEFLLVVGLAHLLLLVVWGLFFLPRSLKAGAGERVQTAGYLHTLIGFAAALLSLERGDVDLVGVLYPLGSALSTSIIGWLLGGEIVSLGANAERRTLDTEYQQVARELAAFGEALQQVHDVYLSTVERATDAYRDLHAQQIELLRQHQQLQTKLVSDNEHQYARLAETQGQLSDRLNALFSAAIVRLGDLSASFTRATQELQAVETVVQNARPNPSTRQQPPAHAEPVKNTQNSSPTTAAQIGPQNTPEP